MSEPLQLPGNVRLNVRSELLKGRAVLSFTDTVTGIEFELRESEATFGIINAEAVRTRTGLKQPNNDGPYL